MAERLGPPPSIGELRALGPERWVLVAGAVLFRVYFRGGPHPTSWSAFRAFGPTNARFDHHEPPPRRHLRRRILYAAVAAATCIAEVFQDLRVLDRHRHRPALVAFRVARDLELLDLTGAWPTRANGSMAIGSGSRKTARDWSRAVYAAYPRIHGLRYASSMNGNAPAFALYERAHNALPRVPLLDLALDEPALAGPLAGMALRFGYAMV